MWSFLSIAVASVVFATSAMATDHERAQDATTTRSQHGQDLVRKNFEQERSAASPAPGHITDHRQPEPGQIDR
jgi:hypothetical protein